MAEFAVVQRECFIQAGSPQTSSPLIVKNLSRYQAVSFTATTVTKVEVSNDDGTTWLDITSLGEGSVTGVWYNKIPYAFKWYRVTYTGTLGVSAN